MTPYKVSTLPRVEILPAVLLTQIMQNIVKEIHIPISGVDIRTGSIIVLFYLRNISGRFAALVS